MASFGIKMGKAGLFDELFLVRAHRSRLSFKVLDPEQANAFPHFLGKTVRSTNAKAFEDKLKDKRIKIWK